MSRRLIAVICSVVLLSLGWLGFGGFTTLVGLAPLLWISDSYGDSRRFVTAPLFRKRSTKLSFVDILLIISNIGKVLLVIRGAVGLPTEE